MTLPAAVELVGEDFLTFNTDYPHPDGTWPQGMADLESQPISDLRGSEGYRRHLVRELTVRALTVATERAQKGTS